MITFVSNTTSISDSFKQGTIDDVVKYCKTKRVLGVDTETEGFDFTCKKMIMFQIGDEDQQFVIDTRGVSIEPLRDILESKDIIKIFHNAKFDYKFIKMWAYIECANVYDTFLVEKVVTCGQELRYGLLHLCERHLGVELNKEVRNQFIGLTGQAFRDDQIVYGAKDVEYLCQIRNKQLPMIDQYKLQSVVDLENESVLAFADIEFNGLQIDRSAWENIAKYSEKEAVEMRDKLDDMLLRDPLFSEFILDAVQGDLFMPVEDIRKVNIKWTSPTQVLKVFQKYVPDLENVNGKQMFKYRRKYPMIDLYVKYKEKMKLATSYGNDFFKFVSCDNKIHTSFSQILDTGRVASSKPNMQQIPADNSFRNCFTAPDGWCFVSSDYSSQELNVIAFGSKDPVWIKALQERQDLHSVCAELVYGEEWMNSAEDDCNYLVAKGKCNCPKHKKLRTNVKTINFGLAYGMGPHKLADTLDISTKDAEKLIDKYFDAFPAIGGFLDKLGNFGKTYGYIKTFPPYNRRRWFPKWYARIRDSRSDVMELGSIERASKNTPIQGASADMTKKALILIRDYIRESGVPVKIVMTVHDQIDTICTNEYADQWKDVMTSLMEQAAIGIVTNGLLKADTNISRSWEK
jgi:DNA polymerase I-like protein with 3'-5' exonuclease and polymerase domains